MPDLWKAVCIGSNLSTCLAEKQWLMPSMVLLIILAVVIILHFDPDNSWGAAFLWFAPLTPLIASSGIVITYVSVVRGSQGVSVDGGFAVMLGTTGAFIIWFFASWLLKRFTWSDMANQDSYNLLRECVTRLEARLRVHCPEELDASKRRYYEQAESHIASIRRTVGIPTAACREILVAGGARQTKNTQGRPGFSWVSALGYSDAFEQIHRADEALIEIDPIEDVIRGAMHDELCIMDSSIQNSAALLTKIRAAIASLNPTSIKYFVPRTAADVHDLLKAFSVASDSLTPDVNSAPNAQATQSPQGVPPQITYVHAQPQNETAEIKLARAALHEVHEDLNRFRDRAWQGLTRSRNHTLGSTALLGVLLYFLVWIAAAASVPPQALLAATLFFLDGAVIGLFSWLQDEARKGRNNDDDYGLSRAQLIRTPLVSGLAAIGGVVIYAMAPALLVNTAPQAGGGMAPQAGLTTPTIVATATAIYAPPFTATPAPVTPTPFQMLTGTPEATTTSIAAGTNESDSTSRSKPYLEQIFSLDSNLFGLIVAAAFGLAPNLLIGSLLKEGDQYKLDIKSTEAPSGVDNSDILT